MNRMHVAAYLVNRATCDHPECAEMRALRKQARRLGRMTIVNYIDHQLTLCPDAQKEDDHEARNAVRP